MSETDREPQSVQSTSDERVVNNVMRHEYRRLSEPEKAAMVGDSLDDDIAGARALGMRAVLVDRERRHPEVEPRLESLQGLGAALGLEKGKSRFGRLLFLAMAWGCIWMRILTSWKT